MYFVNVFPFFLIVPKSGNRPDEESTLHRTDPVVSNDKLVGDGVS